MKVDQTDLLMTYVPEQGSPDRLLPRLTLCVLFYNQRNDVNAVVQSAVAQDYGNSEIILSDDASTDGTGEALLQFARNYRGRHRLVVNVNKVNLGIGNHFKKVFAMCTGEWIATSGGDDISSPNRLSCIADYSRRFPSAAAIGCASRQVETSGSVIGEVVEVSQPVTYHHYTGGAFDYELSPSGKARMAFVAGALAAWRSDVVKLLDFPSNVIAEDVVLSLRAILLGDILFIPEILVDRKLGGISSSGHGHMKRSMRQQYRRRVARMCFLSESAVCEESSRYPFSVPVEFLDQLRHDSSAALLRCFELPFVQNRRRYCNALSCVRRRLGIWQVIKHARSCGTLLNLLWLLANSIFTKKEL